MPEQTPDDGAEGLYENGRLRDIAVCRSGRAMRMLGPAGAEREIRLLPAPEDFPGPYASRQTVLPVLIGSGTGPALAELVSRLREAYGPDFLLAVVDKEKDILAVSGLRETCADCPGLFWIDENKTDEAIKALTRWQTMHGGRSFLPLPNPLYLRLDRAYYSSLAKACESSRQAGFWERARYAKFKDSETRILLLTSKYFLIGEISAACERMGLPYRLLQLPEEEVGCSEFIEAMLSAVLQFRPDFVFTINHLGFDREGVLTELLEKLRLPIASWFVDNPHLILSCYARLVSPWTALFTWDADNLESLRAMGFEHVDYLPLGTDTVRFHPPAGKARFAGLPESWNENIAFVGNSMLEKVAQSAKRHPLPPELTDDFRLVAAGFADDDERSVREYLRANYPEKLRAFDELPSTEARLGYTTMLTWEATLQYRLSCVQGIMPLAPLLIGDTGWKDLLRGDSRPWHYHAELNYYSDLPRLYPCAAINFNCTSKQMKGAVNQRVFDVPATASFLLTDYREQMERLFEPGREIICYRSPEEAEALAREYLDRPKERRAVALAARKRVLAEHSYEHRLRSLITRMREIYG